MLVQLRVANVVCIARLTVNMPSLGWFSTPVVCVSVVSFRVYAVALLFPDGRTTLYSNVS